MRETAVKPEGGIADWFLHFRFSLLDQGIDVVRTGVDGGRHQGHYFLFYRHVLGDEIRDRTRLGGKV